MFLSKPSFLFNHARFRYCETLIEHCWFSLNTNFKKLAWGYCEKRSDETTWSPRYYRDIPLNDKQDKASKTAMRNSDYVYGVVTHSFSRSGWHISRGCEGCLSVKGRQRGKSFWCAWIACGYVFSCPGQAGTIQVWKSEWPFTLLKPLLSLALLELKKISYVFYTRSNW